MRFNRFRFAAVAALSAAAVSVGLASPAAADPAPVVGPAPIPVFQIPSTVLTTSGLLIPGLAFPAVNASTSAVPGDTTFSVPTSQEVCATTFGGSNVRISHLNLSNGASGSVVVKPCDFLDPAPLQATAHTGSGRVIITVSILGTPYRPNPIALPGVGTFVAP